MDSGFLSSTQNMRDLMLIFLECHQNINNLMLQGRKQGVEAKAFPVVCNSH
jgi:hypothetical protein